MLRSPEPQFVYTFATTSIGNLTRERPHAEAVAHLQLAQPIDNVSVYLFLEQEISSSDANRIVLEEVAPKKLKVPSGGASDRFRGIIVSHSEISMPRTTVPQKLSIKLEAQ